MKWQLLGERRAVSLLVLGFNTTIFALGALALGGDWAALFLGLSAVYGLAFFALAAEWFWARWYALGIGMSGMSMALIGMANLGWNEALAVWGLMHLVIYAPLLGEKMAERYENKLEWRERYNIDEYGVARLKRAVSGAATALPTLVMFTLAPRQGAAFLLLGGLAALAGVGLWGLVRLRFWGVLALGASLLGTGVALGADVLSLNASSWAHPLAWASLSSTAALISLAGLTWSISPFVLPAYRFLKRPL